MTTHLYSKQVELDATPEVVFWDLLQPAHVVEYDSRFRSWTPREQPLRLGTEVDFVARAFGIWTKGTSQVVAFDPPHHIELRLVRPPGPLKARLTWNLVETGSGGTSFEYRFQIIAPPGLRWIGRLVLQQFTSHLDTELPALARRYS